MKIPEIDTPLAFVAIQAALESGEMLRKGFGSDFHVASKANPFDLVTEFDKKSEQTIIKHIHEKFPDHSFLAEESGLSYQSSSEVQWVIDPLDGTMNFAHHVPFFGISIAAVVKSRVEVGVFYAPMMSELFVALNGSGAYLNGVPLKVSDAKSLKNGISATGFPYGSIEEKENCFGQFTKFFNLGNPIRILGSAALSLAYVAAGRFDAYWGANLAPWDIAAGKLLIEEAGGKVTHFDGAPLNIYTSPNIVATNSHVHAEVLTNLK